MLTQQTIRHLNHREGSKSRIDRTTKNLLSLSRWIFARNRFTPCLSLSFSFSPMGYDRTTRTRRRQATRQDTRVIRGRGRETIHQQEPPRGCYPLPSVSSAIGRLSPPGEYANFSGGVERDRDSMIRAKVPWCAAPAVFFYFFLFFFFFFSFFCNNCHGNGGSQMQMQIIRPMRTADNCSPWRADSSSVRHVFERVGN